jgi:DNA-binding transcriptional MerR regulator/methylmalonyl-CoA mutase cobalamin-binding subunit
MKYFSIQTVAEMTNLSTHCIRAWEKRYNAITPERSENGRRVYSEKELDRVMMLGRLCQLGNQISLIANLPDHELQALIEKITGYKKEVPVTKNLVSPDIYKMNLFMALSSYKLDIFTHEMNKASHDLSCRDFALNVIAALFRKVGEDVAHGKMSIAQEHTLSALTKFYIGKRIGQAYREKGEKRFTVTLATPPGEQHSIGLLLATLLMAEYGINFIYLGEDLPEQSIADAALATESDAILISVSSVYRSRNINQVLTSLREKAHARQEIWIGGAIDQVNANTIRDQRITTFKDLEALDKKLSQLVGPE